MKILSSELPRNHELKNGKYKIGKKLGSGGFGITYKASYLKEVKIKEGFHEIKRNIEIPVAIKELFIDGKCVRNPDATTISLQGIEAKDFEYFLERFLQEAELLSQFHSVPQIVQVIDFFKENNTAYMVMTFIEGSTLSAVVKSKGPLSEGQTKYLIAEVIKGLESVHAKNILHRDISPDNLIITPENQIILIDFGAARAFLKDKTVINSTILKPGYAPIEQYGQTRRKGPFTDLYALGATSWFALTGKRPVDTTDRISGDNPFQAPGKSKQMNAWLEKATAYEGKDRFATCAEALSFLNGDQTILVSSTPPKEEKTQVFHTTKQAEEQTQVMETPPPNKTQRKQTPKPEDYEEVIFKSIGAKIGRWALVVLASLIALMGFAPFFNSDEPFKLAHIFSILSGIGSIYIIISYIRKRPIRTFLDHLVFGYMFSMPIMFGVVNHQNSTSYFWIPSLFIFLVFFLIYKTSKRRKHLKSLNTEEETKKGPSHNGSTILLYLFILVYCIAYFLPVFDDIIGFAAAAFSTEAFYSFGYWPNLFFPIAAFFYLSQYHKKTSIFLSVSFLIIVFSSCMWWILLKDNGSYEMLLTHSYYIQDLQIGYYIWFTAIIGLTLTVLHDAFKFNGRTKFFWYASVGLIVVVSSWYIRNFSLSQFSLDLKDSIGEVDIERFKELVDKSSTRHLKKIGPNSLSTIMKNYERHADTVKMMFSLLADREAFDEISTKNPSPLHATALLGDLDNFNKLLYGTPKIQFDSLSSASSLGTERSLIYMAVLGENQDIVKRILQKNGTQAAGENIFEIAKSEEMVALLRAEGFDNYEYSNDFSEGPGDFYLPEPDNAKWTIEDEGLELYIKYKGKYVNVIKKSFPFDLNSTYSIKTTFNRLRGSTMNAGIVFDELTATNLHTVAYNGEYISLKKYSNGWSTIKSVYVGLKKGDITLEVIVEKNLLSVYMNGRRIIVDQYFTPFKGDKIGIQSSYSEKYDRIRFKDFSLKGKQKAPSF